MTPEQIRETVATWSEYDREDWDERAAIMEYHGGCFPVEAERLAFDRVMTRRRKENS